MKCQNRWGQAPLFDGQEPTVDGRRYRVFNGTGWGPATTSLALVAAQARAVALAGGAALVWADDTGCGVTVTWTTAEGFALAADSPVPWAAQCRFLLERYG